ncbi:hypothetical protein [Maribacter sp.]|uniref:hypothetical protein n=1 Tax=Maribacter sp. TaxID=1897614 RepID=UPI0025C72F89|nr:hypothetical protein [Maribacter sp.]
MKIKVLIILLFTSIIGYAQVKTDNLPKTYEFNIYDGSESFTMHQFTQNYVAGYRILSRTLDDLIPNKKISTATKVLFIGLFSQPLTHEEGHRSVLTAKGIGSINQPFFNSAGAAYVKGVRDAELINLRNNDISNYIRLHTAGLESDHRIANKIEELVFFEEESYSILREEYVLRKLGLIFYHSTSLTPSISLDLKEEDNELERDIVGHDIWGAVRHLHRPNTPFFRYTRFDDLTNVEKKYARGLAWKSFSNILSPMLFGKTNFRVNPNLKGNFSIVHDLSPFGDYFEQNFYLSVKEKYKFVFYFREFMNKDNTFFAGGVKLYNHRIYNKLNASMGFDVWNQPLNLSFISSEGKLGANTFLKLNYSAIQRESSFIKSIGLFSEFFYKSEGFLPEYGSLDSDFGIRFGIQFSY